MVVERYLGLSKQAAFGTFAALTEYIDLQTESLKEENLHDVPETMRGYDPYHFLTLGYKASGSWEFQPTPENVGLILLGILGAPSTVGAADPYTHTYKSANDPLYLSAGVGTLITAGEKKLTGVAITKLDIEMVAGEVAGMKADFIAQKGEQNALGSPSYDTDAPFMFQNADLDVGGGSIKAFVSAAKVSIERAIADDEYTLGDRLLKYAFPGAVKVAYEVDLYFEALTEWKRFYDGTTGVAPASSVVAPFAVDLELVGDDATSKLNLQSDAVAWTVHENNLDRRSRTMEKVEGVAVYHATKACALQADLLNSVALY